jgi:hypothetical protein
MVISKPKTVAEYLRRLTPEQRAVISAVREVIVRNLPKGYQESTTWGAITYEVPLERFPDTYNGHPLGYAGLAAQKNYFTLHLMRAYGDQAHAKWLAGEFEKRGKKLDMGKACIRFKRLDDLPLDVVGEAIASTPLEAWIANYEALRKRPRPTAGSRRPLAVRSSRPTR